MNLLEKQILELIKMKLTEKRGETKKKKWQILCVQPSSMIAALPLIHDQCAPNCYLFWEFLFRRTQNINGKKSILYLNAY